MSGKELAPVAKKLKVSSDLPESRGSNTDMQLVVHASNADGNTTTATAEQSALVPRSFERLMLTINPEYVTRLNHVKVLGFARTFAQRNPTYRYYTINLVNFRDAITSVLQDYLDIKYHDKGEWSNAQITQELAYIIPIIVDACVTALYARLRPVHKSLGTYANRFGPASIYHKDMELPLPIADAIQYFGTFNPVGTTTNHMCVPLYPENTPNEGRVTANWNGSLYETAIPMLKDLGIPFKSVDTRIKSGSPWWLLKSEIINGDIDLRCIFPPSNYSDHSALLASIFCLTNANNTEVRPVINFLANDVKYPVRFREIAPGFKVRAFAALCHAPREEWNQYLLLD